MRKTEYFPFEGGLNLETPALSVKSGELIGCQNYECAIEGGYRRIDGYERFSSYPLASEGVYHTVDFDSGEHEPEIGETVVGGTSFATGVVVAIVDNLFIGDELHVDANAIADPASNETDATTGWTGANLSGSGNVFQSQSSVKNVGSYAFEAYSNGTPTAAARFSKDIETDLGLTIGNSYRVQFDIRHVGTGGDWRANLGTLAGGSENPIQLVTNTDVTFQTVTYDFIHDSTTKFLNFRETSGTNDGGVYVDDLSIKQLIGGEWGLGNVTGYFVLYVVAGQFVSGETLTVYHPEAFSAGFSSGFY